jgi:Zn-dependent protease/CBS domain-containing protein
MAATSDTNRQAGPAPSSRAPDEGLFHASIPLGRVAGVELGANWSWLLILGLMVWSLGAVVFPEQNPGLSDAAYAAMAGVAALLFFGCLLAHELGHALQAQREGMEIEGITLWVFGGVARFRGMFPSAGSEFRIAIAGPLVSLVLGVTLTGVAALLPLPAAVDGVATWLGRINLILLAFNMLPALPLDGGRVLRSLLWRRSGDFSRATRTAGALGTAFGQVMIALGLVSFLFGGAGGLWLAFIGWFLTRAAGAESRLAEMRTVLAGMEVRDAMVRDPVTAQADATLQAFMDDVFAPNRHTAYPVIAGGVTEGEITFRAVADVPREQWTRLRVRDRMLPLDAALVFDEGEPLFDAAVELMQRPPNRALVTDDGRLSGMLSITDVSRLLELRRL